MGELATSQKRGESAYYFSESTISCSSCDLLNSPNRFAEAKVRRLASIPRVRLDCVWKVNAGLTFWFFCVKTKEQNEIKTGSTTKLMELLI
jgi:hypothetical protein